MSIQAISGQSTAWQTLAELQAARAAADDPNADPAQASAWSSAAAGATTSGNSAGTPPQPPPSSVLQFFQQLQSVDTSGPANGANPSGGGGTSAETGITGIFDDLQSLVTQGEQGATAGVPQGQGAPVPNSAANPAVSNGGTADATGATQTGNDLALQLAAGLQGSAWQAGLVPLLA